MAEESDFELLERMQARDEQALGALYDRWSARVHALAIQFLGREDEAEDVVEETFWQVWRSAKRYQSSRGTVGTWVIMIARSRALDRLRARRRSREERWEELPKPAAGDPLFQSVNSPLQNAADAERRRMVLAALAELPAEQREVLELAYYGGMSQSEIAEHTGQPLGTVKTRVRLGLRKLRDRLDVLRERAP